MIITVEVRMFFYYFDIRFVGMCILGINKVYTLCFSLTFKECEISGRISKSFN